MDLQTGKEVYGTDRIRCKPAQISKADLFYPIVRQDESIVAKAQRGHLSRIATERTYVAILECANHRLVICHDLSPPGVDNDALARQRSEFFLAYEMDCVVWQRDMDTQHVRFTTEHLDGLDVLAPCGGVRDMVPIIIANAHRKSAHELGQVEPVTTLAQDAECARGMVMRISGRDRSFPCPGVQP